MTREEIARELVSGISAIAGKREAALSADTPLADVGVDSLMLVEIFVLVEKKFKLQLLESNVRKEDLQTIETLAAHIARKL